MARTKNASKELVYAKLREALDWCNAHSDSAQQRFNRCVDIIIDPQAYKTRNQEMKSLFPVLMLSKFSGYRPGIPVKETCLPLDSSDFLDMYFTTWAKKYFNAWKVLPSQRIASPKGAATDPALIKMVEPRAGSIYIARDWASYHNLFMSAENVGGNLLEEYIYTKVCNYGWMWCRGEVLTAVDFCSMGKERFIQIKNKSNTENSSGKGFREDHDADKWYRMEAQKKDGNIITRWSDLVKIIQEGAPDGVNVPTDIMTEESYLDFVRNAAAANPALITDQER
ncbi:SinI family restriction endonuclease [Bifidobacterium miconisargentati]|uniref:SinI family restriction endonuclease n=1 Tax=Bifidobacterium miconisargentati TaxID=2834437 RepID=UPI001BDC1A52|nr:SinI family restriction endonuclease [Bifidobacterium miconisargentati]MBW3090263.1 SinI family restriction endonuclease [Bifidobacterium miconisargentati]